MAKTIWVEDTLTGKLKGFDDWFVDALDLTMQRQAGRAETYMRQNAPWTDQTSNARNGLRAFVERSGSNGTRRRRALVLSHGMPYGIWLETRFSGKYAIIVPSLNVQGKELMSTLSKILESL